LKQTGAQRIDLAAVELPSVGTGQIEDVDCPLAVRRDVRGMDLVAFVVDRRCQCGEQRRPVARIDLDDRRAGGSALGNGDRRRDMEGGAARASAFGARQRGRFLAAQRRLNRARQPVPYPAIGIGLTAAVEHEEIVERSSIARGVDPRVDDVPPGRCDARADSIKQPLAIGREDADSCRSAFRFVLDDDARLGLADACLGGRDLLCICDLPGKRLGEPVAIGETLRVRADRARFPAELGRQCRLPPFDELGAAMLPLT